MSWAKNSVGERGDNIGLPDVTTADNGKIMEVEAGEWKLKEGSGGGGGIPAPENPSDGDVLTYSSADDEWVAAAPSGGGGGSVLLITADNTGTLNKTGQEIATAFTGGSMCIVVKQTTSEDLIDTMYCIIVEYRTSISGSDYYYDFIALGEGGGSMAIDFYTCENLSDYPAIMN